MLLRLHRSTRRCTWRSRAGGRAARRRRCASCPAIPRRLPVGALRAQPRRADARQAHRAPSARRSSPPSAPSRSMQLYGRGLRRRLPTMLDGDERALRMVYCSCSRCPARRCCSTARRSAWARTSRSRAAMSVRAPMQWSDEPNGGFSDRGRRGAVPPAGRGRVRARARQRRRPAARPRLAAELVRAPDPPPARVPGARLRGAARCSTPASPRSSPTAATGTARRSSPCTTSPGHDVKTTLPLEDGEALVDLFGTDDLEAPFTLALKAYEYRWYRLRRPGQRIAP